MNNTPNTPLPPANDDLTVFYRKCQRSALLLAVILPTVMGIATVVFR